MYLCTEFGVASSHELQVLEVVFTFSTTYADQRDSLGWEQRVLLEM